MDILFQDRRIVVAVKPSGILSTDEPGGRSCTPNASAPSTGWTPRYPA